MTPPPGPDARALENELLWRARTEPECFGELFKLLWPILIDRLTRQTFCAETAADIGAETFAKAVVAVDSYRPHEGNAQAWLWGIAQNILRGWLRTGRVESRARRRVGFDPVITHDDVDDVLARTVAEDLRDEMRAALIELTPEARQTVQLRVTEHLSFAEIARVQGCRVDTARMRYARAIGELRIALAKSRGSEAW